MTQTKLFRRLIIARGNKAVPLGPNDYAKQMAIERRIRERHG